MASSTNSNNMCRLCLSANGITEPICYDQRDQFLLQKIYECTTLQISPLNGIPSSLCTLCKARLDEFYQFRWQCIKNDEIIRRIADSFHSNKPTVVDSSAASPITSQSPSQNPKQEVIDLHPTEVPTVVDGRSSTEYNSGSGGEERRVDEREVIIGYGEHMDHSMGVRPHQEGYSLGEQGHPGHGQYAIGPSVVPYNGEHAPGFHPEHKYSEPHQYDFSDFRRKRGRPPKQKYDVYHHPIVKYDESSIDTKSSAHVPSSSMSQESGSILTYGEGTSRGSEYQHGPVYGEWNPQTKIKLEQIDHQQVRYDEQEPTSPEEHDQKLQVTSNIQTVVNPDGFVKRSRGRPPREGGCPNQDRAEYRFQCQYCDARFKAAINLKLHTNTHTGERPYKCQLCDKSFAHPSNLSVHTKLHTQERVKREGVPSEKKFQCPYCHTLFALAFQLKIHINTHTGQKPYVCKNCGKGFAQPSNLHVHIKKHCHKRTEYQEQQNPSEQHHSPEHLASQHINHQPQHHLPHEQHYHPVQMAQHPPVVPQHPQPSLSHQQHSPLLQTAQAIDPSVPLNHTPPQQADPVEPESPPSEKHQETSSCQPPPHTAMGLASVMLV